jgi:hypothetical protein
VKQHTKRFGVVVGVAVFAVALSACRLTGFNNSAAKSSGASAVQWLVKQQQSDGGFEVSGFAGFETPDAILAIAENAQQQAGWNASQALAAVQAVKKNGHTPLHNIDDFVDGPIGAGQAAKIIVLVAKPLNRSVSSFDPDGDGAKNLIATVNSGAQANGSYGSLNDTLFAALAKKLVDGSVPAKTLAFIRAAQQVFGGWDFSGNPNGASIDIDTTGIALAALAAAGVPGNDPDLRQGLRFLANVQHANGAFPDFNGDDNPNSTASGLFGIVAAGFDPTSSCWRNLVEPNLAGHPYGSPVAWLRTQQVTNPSAADFGRIRSPFDAPGNINTFATSQTVQAFRYAWMPPSPLSAQQCP